MTTRSSGYIRSPELSVKETVLIVSKEFAFIILIEGSPSVARRIGARFVPIAWNSMPYPKINSLSDGNLKLEFN